MQENSLQTGMLRTIDASANRALEGLRVVEDIIRFCYEDAHLCRRLKGCRHAITEQMKSIPFVERARTRETILDVGTDIKTEQEFSRQDVAELLLANFQRTKEALRSLSECSKMLADQINPAIGLAFEQIRYDIYTFEKSTIIAHHSCDRLQHAQLCVLVAAGNFESLAAFETYVKTLVNFKVGMIQLREKSCNDNQLLFLAKRLREITRGSKSLCIINDRADIAAAISADGVHVGQDDLPVAQARKIVGAGQLVGVSTHDIEQARSAVIEGADYLGVGPTFPSVTKEFSEFSGLSFVQDVATEISLPAFAIGGITPDNVEKVAAHGIRRAAVQATLQDLAHDETSLQRAIGDLRKGLSTPRKVGENQPQG